MLSWLTRLEKVHKVHTEEERAAVYRLRYSVYVEEMNKHVPEVDAKRKWIRDPEDELSGTVLYYTGSPQRMTGTLRITAWDPGAVPEEFREKYGLDFFPGINSLTIVETSRLIATADLRGKLILPALACVGYEDLIKNYGTFLVFAYCAPGLVNAYRRLGYRPYAAKFIAGHDGLRVPLVLVPSDFTYLKSVNSPFLTLAKSHYGSGKLPPIDLHPFRHVLECKDRILETSPDAVWHDLQQELAAHKEDVNSFFKNLSNRDLQVIKDLGFIMNVPSGQTIVAQGVDDREMFVILKGVFEVFDGDRRLAVLFKGEIFGELALLLDSGRRTASIRSLSDGELFVLRRKFLKHLMAEHPEIASKILYNVSRTLAKRFANLIQSEMGD